MIKTLEIFELNIPFNISFKHHSAERKSTQSIIVKVTDENYCGYGESCPREYVTNESINSVFNFCNQHKEKILKEIADFNSLLDFRQTNKININNNLAAWCAIELALLDLFAKQKQCSVEKLLNLPELNGDFEYTAVLGNMSESSFERMATKYFEMGFENYKLKISEDKASDHAKISFLKSLNKNLRIRLDGNNCWNNINEALNYFDNIPGTVIGLEEPLKNKNLNFLKELSQKITTPIILDESFCTYEDFEKIEIIEDNSKRFILNLRVSKMGGLLNCLNIAQTAAQKKLKIIIGCQVGETSILTRAGLTIANATKPYYSALEGAFGTLLLQYDIVDNSLTFAQGGKLNPTKHLNPALGGFGLKVTF